MNFGSCGRWRNGQLSNHCTMAVVGADGLKNHLFRTRAEEDAAVARSPLKVAADLLALAQRVGGAVPQLYECAECSRPDCNWRGQCDGESCPVCGGHVVEVPSGVTGIADQSISPSRTDDPTAGQKGQP